MAGRPSDYSEELAATICDEVANGSNLNQIGKRDDMPSRQSIYKWMRENEEFADNYARAREDRADWRADRIDDIVERMLAGEFDAAEARVAIDALKWQAGKEKPKWFGDKLDLNHGGQDDNPVVTRIERVIVDPSASDS